MIIIKDINLSLLISIKRIMVILNNKGLQRITIFNSKMLMIKLKWYNLRKKKKVKFKT